MFFAVAFPLTQIQTLRCSSMPAIHSPAPTLAPTRTRTCHPHQQPAAPSPLPQVRHLLLTFSFFSYRSAISALAASSLLERTSAPSSASRSRASTWGPCHHRDATAIKVTWASCKPASQFTGSNPIAPPLPVPSCTTLTALHRAALDPKQKTPTCEEEAELEPARTSSARLLASTRSICRPMESRSSRDTRSSSDRALICGGGKSAIVVGEWVRLRSAWVVALGSADAGAAAVCAECGAVCGHCNW